MPEITSRQDVQQWQCPDWRLRIVATVIFVIALTALFADFLGECLSRWSNEPQYSHGFLIPFMAIGLGWCRRHRIPAGVARSSWPGILLLSVGAVLHVSAGYLYFSVLDAAALLCMIAGAVLLVWGRRFFRGVWPAILFLSFMMPLPFELERAMSAPLQLLGASEAAFYIQTLGIPAVAQGSTILMVDTQLGVEEACSGMRMMMVFLAICVAAAIISERPRWEKIIILLSAIPIALVCNIARIVATAYAHHTVGSQMADLVFHDVSGWLMIVMGFILLKAELLLFDWLFIEIEDQSPGIGLRTMVPACSTGAAQ